MSLIPDVVDDAPGCPGKSTDPLTGARFFVIIVNYNGRDYLGACLRSVHEEGVPTHQIVVIDNGSHDTSVAEARAAMPGLRVIENGCNAGFARAVNQGLRIAVGDFALLLNNDASLLPGALAALADAFDRITTLVIAGGALSYPDGRHQRSVAAIPTLAREVLPRGFWPPPGPPPGRARGDAYPVASVIGALLAVRRPMLSTLGLLDEDYFFFLEETEWCLRARRQGGAVYHVPTARAVHVQGATVKHFHAAARIEFQRSKLTFFRKTQSPASYVALSAWLPLKAIINALVLNALMLLTAGLVGGLRARARGYRETAYWHLRGRPASVGLPDKCPVAGAPR